MYGEGLPLQIRLSPLPGPLLTDAEEQSPSLLTDLFDDGHRLRQLRRADDQSAVFDDARLLSGDEGQSAA